MSENDISVLIINQHSHNFGDDAAGTALINRLLLNSRVSRIDIIYNSCDVAIPVTNEKVHHRLDISLRKVGILELLKFCIFGGKTKYKTKSSTMKKWINIIDRADYIYVAPCGANIGIYKDWLFLFRVYMIIRRKKTPIFHYNTIGKSGSPIFDFFAKRVLKKSIIFVRETKSKKYLESLGLKAKFGPDTAFMLSKCEIEIRDKVIGFVPSEFGNWHPNFKRTNIDLYIQNNICKEIAEICIKGNYKIELLPHLNTNSEKEYYEKIRSKLIGFGVKSTMVVIRNDINNFMKYDEAIASCQFIIGMRYHTIVLAVKNERPFISICYENKMNELCQYTGMHNYHINLDSMNDNEILHKFRLLEENSEKIRITLKQFMTSQLISSLKEATNFIDM